ncbi:MAG TPA: hypothetical protein VEO95_11205, partial [Chthoniobacteraceae bacterium]|nr:hypothetical protein [Chthoniobacteraceae bacterium]
MRTTSSASASAANPVYEVRRQPKRRFRFLWFVPVLLVVLVLAFFEPHCFQFGVRQVLRFEAWRSGVSAQLGRVDGSVFEPVRVLDSVWIYESENGPVTRVEVKEIAADFSWRALFSRGSSAWFRQLTLEGVTGKVQLPIEERAATPRRPRFHLPRPRGQWLSGPERIEARNADFIFESDGDYVRLQNARFTISELEPGELFVGQLVIKQPWLSRTFRNVKGTTKLDDARTELAAVALEPGVSVQNLSVELAEIARGRLNLEVQIAAFGGGIRIETQTRPDNRQLVFEATSTFSQIAIGKLATFLGQSDAAGGTIKEGKFTFRGSPQNPAGASAEVRVEATNFQWETRQWDSLVLGAKLLAGRVQIPTLTLYQGHNFLNLRGEFALPAPKQEWWQNEFAFDVNAKIENLTELSALMLPEFKYAAGKGTIDGSVRGDHQQFNGQIIVSGSNLTWHNAPIEELHATLKLNGNELQLANLSVFNGGDFVRGRGVVNILGDKQYWGELRASIDELGRYAALLQQPIVPEPIAGGGVIDWTGEGSAKGHTGKFFARLRKLRSLGASSALLHPINAEFDGSYQPGAILFNRFALADDASSFTANVSVGNKALSLQDVRFVHGAALQLQGDAVLPLDVWQAWPNTNLATLLNDATVSKIHLVASDLDLHAASQLTGWNFPIEGTARGEITAEGALGAIASKGHLTLAKARIPLGWTGVLLTDAAGKAALDGQKLAVTKFAGRHPGGDVQLSGEVDFTNVRDPLLKLALTSARSELELFPAAASSAGGIKAAAALALAIDGPSSAPTVTGDATLVSLRAAMATDLAPVLLGDSPVQIPDAFELPAGAWNAWRFDLAWHSAEPLPLGTGAASASADLRLRGTAADPELIGMARIVSQPARIGDTPATIDEATFEFRAGAAHDPSLTLRASGAVLGEPFVAEAAGPLSRLMRFFICDPPLTPESLRAQLRGKATAIEPHVSLLAPAAQAGGVEIYS